MFSETLICVGKLKEPFYLSAAAEYQKRLRGLCGFELIELPEIRLPDAPSQSEIAQALAKEAAAIRAKIPKGSWLCVLAIEGKTLSSQELAARISAVKNGGKSSACFVIGSSFGLDETLKREADFRLSMSPMTFPHHLARVMVLEQLYRAESIQAGTKYHK